MKDPAPIFSINSQLKKFVFPSHTNVLHNSMGNWKAPRCHRLLSFVTSLAHDSQFAFRESYYVACLLEGQIKPKFLSRNIYNFIATNCSFSTLYMQTYRHLRKMIENVFFFVISNSLIRILSILRDFQKMTRGSSLSFNLNSASIFFISAIVWRHIYSSVFTLSVFLFSLTFFSLLCSSISFSLTLSLLISSFSLASKPENANENPKISVSSKKEETEKYNGALRKTLSDDQIFIFIFPLLCTFETGSPLCPLHAVKQLDRLKKEVWLNLPCTTLLQVTNDTGEIIWSFQEIRWNVYVDWLKSEITCSHGNGSCAKFKKWGERKTETVMHLVAVWGDLKLKKLLQIQRKFWVCSQVFIHA